MPRMDVTVLFIHVGFTNEVRRTLGEEEEEESWAALNHRACKFVPWAGPPRALNQSWFGAYLHPTQSNSQVRSSSTRQWARVFWTEKEERNRRDPKLDRDKFWVFRFFTPLLVPELFAGVAWDPHRSFLDLYWQLQRQRLQLFSLIRRHPDSPLSVLAPADRELTPRDVQEHFPIGSFVHLVQPWEQALADLG